MGDRPKARAVSLDLALAQEVATAFALGRATGVSLAARGWVSLNVTWRVTTTSGVWAIKEIARESRELLDAAARIEVAAERLGIPLPRPVRSRAGSVAAAVRGRVFRCHEFVKGELPAEDLHETDARDAGAALGRIHAAELPWDPILMTRTTFGEDHWLQLIERGAENRAPWVDDLRSALAGILVAESAAAEWHRRDRHWVGSHRDVRPDNTMRAAGHLLLVDWDGAGPVVRGREVASARRWWRPHEDALLDAYCDVTGEVDLEEGAGEDGGLVWWLETNVAHALALPGDEERDWAVSALSANFRRHG